MRRKLPPLQIISFNNIPKKTQAKAKPENADKKRWFPSSLCLKTAQLISKYKIAREGKDTLRNISPHSHIITRINRPMIANATNTFSRIFILDTRCSMPDPGYIYYLESNPVSCPLTRHLWPVRGQATGMNLTSRIQFLIILLFSRSFVLSFFFCFRLFRIFNFAQIFRSFV